MNCDKCGKKLTEDANFCRICGTPVKKKSDNSETKKIEFTDNIDVTKISIDRAKLVEDIDDYVTETEEEMDKKITAMLEITSTESQSNRKQSVDDGAIINDSNKVKNEDNELRLDSVPGEVNDLEIQSTSEIEELLSKKITLLDSSVLESIEKDEKVIESDDLNAPTMVLPTNFTKESIEDKDKVALVQEYNVSGEKQAELDKGENNSIEEKKDIVSNKVESEKNETNLSFEHDALEENVRVSTNEITLVNNDENFIDIDNKKKGKGCLAVAILLPLLILSICAIGYLWFRLNSLNNDYKDIEIQNKELSTELEKVKLEQLDGVQDATSIDNKIKINGYEIALEDVKYNFDNGTIIIDYEEKNFYSEIKLNENYDELKLNKDDYKEYLEEQNLSVQSYGTKVIEEREYVVYEVTDEMDKVSLVAYTKLEEDDVIGFVVTSSTEEIDYNILSTFNKIVEAAKKDEKYEPQNLEFFKE